MSRFVQFYGHNLILPQIEANRQEALAKKQQAEERKKVQIEAQIETNRQEALAKKQQAEERKKAHIRVITTYYSTW